MSDIQPNLAPPIAAPRRHRGPPKRFTIVVDGKAYKPRDEVADIAGISHRDGARRWKKFTRYVGGVSYVCEPDALRDLVTAPPARTMRRGRRPIP
jgi:hypothetical protein